MTEIDRSGRRLVRLSRMVLALNVLLLLLATGLHIAVELNHGFRLISGVFLTAAIVLGNSVVALLIVSRYPRHTIGWLMLSIGLIVALQDFSGYGTFFAASLVSLPNPFVDFLGWVVRWIWVPFVVVVIFLIPLFYPNGRLLSKRWRFGAVAATMAMVVGTASQAIHPGDFTLHTLILPNPYFAGDAALADFLFDRVTVGLLNVALVGAYGSIILRYRRSSGVERAQLKWALYTLVLGMVALSLLGQVASRLPEDVGSELEELSNRAIGFIALSIPVFTSFAILRYRLYDIDIIIRRTLVYSIVTLALAAVYFGSVVLLQRLLAGATDQQSPVAIVLSTLLIAALFAPLRRRVQEVIDRSFYRRKYDAQQVLAQFAITTRDETDLKALTAALVRVVEETMRPAAASLWLAAEKPNRRLSTSLVEPK